MPNPVRRLINLSDHAKFWPEQFVNLKLWDGEAFFGRLLCFQRGQSVPLHVHEHKDECFDVIQGEGTLIAAGQEFRAGAGTMLYVPAGVTHGLYANISERWVLRETVSERVYARRALRLIGRAIFRRLGLISAR